LVGLAMILRRRRYRRCGAWDHGWHRHGHHHGGGRFSWHGFLASRLEATPEQHKVIRDELEGFWEKTRELRRELRLSRDDIAKAMRSDAFDEEVMGESFSRQDDRIREIREALVGALAKIHDVLDERQRRRLADLVESMDRFGGRSSGGGPRWM
jgi:Spy/CpxP family protein refolding chaperone